VNVDEVWKFVTCVGLGGLEADGGPDMG
jgi:hypothetical protein